MSSFRRLLCIALAVANSSLFILHSSLLTSCQADGIVSRRYGCHFVFSYEQHSTSLLFAAARSAGTYVYVTMAGDGKTTARHVYVTSNDGKTPREDNIIATDKENYTTFQLGASNSIGIFIGLTNFNGLWAYDRQCPNCGGSQALNFTGNRQQVGCGKCQRIYDLETGGIVSGEQGDPLMRYFCSFDGTLLRAWN
jgi:nitrite reductase/ring-hydroxylating ferredoxin subunit